MNWNKRYAEAINAVTPNIPADQLSPRDAMIGVPLHELWPHLQPGGNLHSLVNLYLNPTPGIRRDDIPLSEHDELMDMIKQVHGNPNAPITIYRAQDADHVPAIYRGDWVGISPTSVETHGIRRGEGGQFGPNGFTVVQGEVPASHLRSVTWAQQGGGWKREMNHPTFRDNTTQPYKLQPGVIRPKHFDFLYDPR